MAQPSHIFIVGAPRTGTSIIRSVLNCSDNVAICGETQFLGAPRTATSLVKWFANPVEHPGFYQHTRFLKKPASPGSWESFVKLGDISTNIGAEKIVDYIYNKRPSFWRWLPDNVDQAEFLQKLLMSDRTERSFFDLLLSFYAGDKPIRGEKTPHHIHHVPTLLKWFPEAKIIHTFRDVRAVFVSQQRKKFKQQRERMSPRHQLFKKSVVTHEIYLSINVLIQWLRVVQLHQQYQKRYPDNYYLCKFEDVVTGPMTHLKKLCDFLEIDFTKTMLQQSVFNSSFIPRNQRSGLDASVAHHWRKYLRPAINKWLVLWTRRYLLEFGYQL